MKNKEKEDKFKLWYASKPKELDKFYKEIECSKAQQHLKECKECSGGEWEKEFDEKFAEWKMDGGKLMTVGYKEDIKQFISKVAKTERSKYPEGYQGKE